MLVSGSGVAETSVAAPGSRTCVSIAPGFHDPN